MYLLHLLEIIDFSNARRAGIDSRPRSPNELIPCAALCLWSLFLQICVGADPGDLSILGLYQFLELS